MFQPKKKEQVNPSSTTQKKQTQSTIFCFFHIHDLLSRLKGGKGWLSQEDKEGWAEYLLHIYSSCHALLWCCYWDG